MMEEMLHGSLNILKPSAIHSTVPCWLAHVPFNHDYVWPYGKNHCLKITAVGVKISYERKFA